MALADCENATGDKIKCTYTQTWNENMRHQHCIFGITGEAGYEHPYRPRVEEVCYFCVEPTLQVYSGLVCLKVNLLSSYLCKVVPFIFSGHIPSFELWAGQSFQQETHFSFENTIPLPILAPLSPLSPPTAPTHFV
jgi:hypothetical protein